jgi:hypothetical protein
LPALRQQERGAGGGGVFRGNVKEKLNEDPNAICPGPLSPQ